MVETVDHMLLLEHVLNWLDRVVAFVTEWVGIKRLERIAVEFHMAGSDSTQVVVHSFTHTPINGNTHIAGVVGSSNI